MSARQYSPAQLRWYAAGFGVLARRFRHELDNKKLDDAQILHLLWRLGVNEYGAGECQPAIEHLLKLANMLDTSVDVFGLPIKRMPSKFSVLHRSKLHQIIGRSAAFLFAKTRQHVHLETAQKHYEIAVQSLILNLDTMIELPKLLIEYGQVLECYGAFEAALGVYSTVLTKFPTFRGYFDALYRTAIVGRYLSMISNDSKQIEEVTEKTVDILQFLLEALPSNIQDVHIVFYLARTLESSRNMQLRFRSQGVYSSLYQLFKKRTLLGAHKSDEKEWISDPTTWMNLGILLDKQGELLIAREAFGKFIDEAKRKAKSERALSEILTVDICIVLAKHSAAYQNFAEAVRYLEIGLTIDRYNKQLRDLVVEFSPQHRSELNKDVLAVAAILVGWRQRCWNWGFIHKLRAKRIAEQEKRLSSNHFDESAREELAYYARDKYRPSFLFEIACAVRIQRAFRKCRKMWIWQEAQRRNFSMQASELHYKLMRDMYNPVLRKDTLNAIKHKYMPRKHPLHVAARTVVVQDNALRCIVRALKAFKLRAFIDVRVESTRAQQRFVMTCMCIRIQTACRRLLARRQVRAIRRARLLELRFVLRIQRAWRVHASSDEYLARIQARRALRNRGKAMFVFRKRLLPLIRRYRRRRRRGAERSAGAERKSVTANIVSVAPPSRSGRHYTHQEMIQSALRIQRFYRHYIANIWQRVARIAVMQRRHQSLSSVIDSDCKLSSADIFKMNAFSYSNPGLDARSSSYQRLLIQSVIVCKVHAECAPADCDGSVISLVDLAIFGSLLSDPHCRVERIIFCDCLLPSQRNVLRALRSFCSALNKCLSLQSVWIIGGSWCEEILLDFFHLVQVDNARVKQLVVEKLLNGPRLFDVIGLAASRLLKDYFNFSLPGLQSLSLHGCYLRDDQVLLIAEGIEVNSSLQELCCSLNWITDKGFILLMKAMIGNIKSNLLRLDLSSNLINLGHSSRELLMQYRSLPHQKSLLEIIMINNRIHEPLEMVDFALAQRISPQFVIKYNLCKSEHISPDSATEKHLVSPFGSVAGNNATSTAVSTNATQRLRKNKFRLKKKLQ